MSNQTKHTPTPYNYSDKHTPVKVTSCEIESLCEHALLKSIPDSTRTTAHWLIANSKKVSAAPDLLAALKLCVARLEEYEDAEGGIALEGARAAIARAKEGK